MTHDLRARIAKALGWTQAEVGQFSLPALRELVRPIDKKLTADIEEVVAGAKHWTRKGRAGGNAAKRATSAYEYRILGSRGEMALTKSLAAAKTFAKRVSLRDGRGVKVVKIGISGPHKGIKTEVASFGRKSASGRAAGAFDRGAKAKAAGFVAFQTWADVLSHQGELLYWPPMDQHPLRVQAVRRFKNGKLRIQYGRTSFTVDAGHLDRFFHRSGQAAARSGMAKGTAFKSDRGVRAGAVSADRFYEFDELPKKEQKFFDWAKGKDERFVRVPYGSGSKKRYEYVAVEDFQHTPSKKAPSGRPADGFATDSYFSGVAIKLIPEKSGSEFDYQVWTESW